MAHFAQLDEYNIVVNVAVVPDEQEHRGQEYMADDLGLGGTWIQTSYNTVEGTHISDGTPLRHRYAGVGMTYDSERDVFLLPKPFDSWVLDENLLWDAPVPMPEDPPEDETKMWSWDEETTSWVEGDDGSWLLHT